ncbi:MAG: hypothetical protein AAGD92_03685 [Pseudomonadota bacterium]
MNFRLIAICSLFMLGGCVSYYETAFDACDAEAGACYRACEVSEDEEQLRRCHASCEERANICFDEVYAAQQYDRSPGYAYGPRPYYGPYGFWRPGLGYSYSFGFYDNYPRSYRDRYRSYPYYGGYRYPYYRDYYPGRGLGRGGRGRGDRRRNDDGGSRGGPGRPPGANPPPPNRTPPPRRPTSPPPDFSPAPRVDPSTNTRPSRR